MAPQTDFDCFRNGSNPVTEPGAESEPQRTCQKADLPNRDGPTYLGALVSV